jgi:hypothetical protein
MQKTICIYISIIIIFYSSNNTSFKFLERLIKVPVIFGSY